MHRSTKNNNTIPSISTSYILDLNIPPSTLQATANTSTLITPTSTSDDHNSLTNNSNINNNSTNSIDWNELSKEDASFIVLALLLIHPIAILAKGEVLSSLSVPGSGGFSGTNTAPSSSPLFVLLIRILLSLLLVPDDSVRMLALYTLSYFAEKPENSMCLSMQLGKYCCILYYSI